MKFLHLADLHIGKRVHEHPMADEQRNAFAQMTAAAREHAVDAVLVAGDVFDRAVPSRDALELAEEFFAGFISLGIPVFAVPGNHDSAQQLSYCSGITAAAGLHIAKAYTGRIETFRLKEGQAGGASDGPAAGPGDAPEEGQAGGPAPGPASAPGPATGPGPVYIHLLPFLRPTDVRMALPERANEVATHDDAVRIALEEHPVDARARNILVAHQFVVNGEDRPEPSGSEIVNVGGIDSVQAAHFDAFDYVALGHLHGIQSVRRPQVRYCGSPLKYSFSEVKQRKAISLVELGGPDGRAVTVTELPLVPLHEMREITAPFDELLAGCDKGDRDDYLRIVLTDQSAYDAQNRLRALYPNLLQLDWADMLSNETASGVTLADIRQLSVQELFAGFFEKQTGRQLDETERAIVDEAVLRAEGGSR